MKKDYFKYMNDTAECIDEFTAACEEMLDSTYILADKKISQILKSIAGYTQLYFLFKNTLAQFDYDYEFDTADCGNSFILPENQNTCAALIFCLLLDFDLCNKSLKEFLYQFFPAPTLNEQYSGFCKSIIARFLECVTQIYNNLHQKILA